VDRFTVAVEVVPPAGPDAEPLLAGLGSLTDQPIDGFSVATNPVAKPRMSAMSLCVLIQRRVGKPTTLHCTTRDHNRLSLQGLLWGACALGIESVLVTTGDFVALGDRVNTTMVRDVDVFDLIGMAREVGLRTGVAFDSHAAPRGMERAVRRLERKLAAGAQFAVTQPVYDASSADELAQATSHIDKPIVMGILPLRTFRHAEFLHHRVAGISVPQRLRERMAGATDSVAEGVAHAREMLGLARQSFAGACIMPPFGHYEIVPEVLA
jgi:homocysteine S-methyltransferase